MNETLPNFRFPDASQFPNVTILPVYVEPLAFSGERIFVGLITHSKEGARSFPLEGLRRLRCVYGPAYRSLLVARDIALASLLEWVNRHGLENAGQWVSPGDGIFLGNVLHTTASSIAEAVRTSFSEFSSIYDEPTALIQQEPTQREERLAGLTASRLEATVRDIVASVRPDLSERFLQRFQVNANARPMTLGFVGGRIVANFGLIVPEALSAHVSNAKARLWDLASARAGMDSGWFGRGEISQFNLLVHHANESDVQYSRRQLSSVNEALAELEAEADKLDIRCEPIVGPQAIANRLIAAES